MKIITKIIIMCAVALFVSGCTQSVTDENSTSSESTQFEAETTESESYAMRTENEIIRDIILYYGYYQDKADGKVDALLSELKSLSTEQYDLWKEIYEYWKYTNDDLQVNYGKLPDDLPEDDSLCLVALGYKLNDDGSIRDELEGRLQVLLDCANQYPDSYVAVTGGGTASGNKNVTEAGQMAKWLVEHGLSERRIIVEDKSLTTAQNAINTYEILRSQYPQVDTVAIISSDYHIGWGSVLFQSVFMKNQEGSELDISVVSNAASSPEDPEDYPFSFQAAGLLEIAGDETAWDIYYYKFDESTLENLD